MGSFVRPPEEWSQKDLEALGKKSGVTYIKAVPVLILEEWERQGKKEGEPFYVKTDKIVERIEDSGLHPRFQGKDKSNIVAPLTTIQRARNLNPFLIKNVKKGYSQINLPYYEPLLRRYLQYYQENYIEDYKKLYPDEMKVIVEKSESTSLSVKPVEPQRKPVTILQVLEDYDKTWQDRLEKAEIEIKRLTEELENAKTELNDIKDNILNQSETPQNIRERIPQDVRIAVWRRDGGKCARCGSREKLEYDHIVPVSKGGSNTDRNVELLCEKCNRSKRNNIR